MAGLRLSTSLRGRELKEQILQGRFIWGMSTSLRGRELKVREVTERLHKLASTSLRGRELKGRMMLMKVRLNPCRPP